MDAFEGPAAAARAAVPSGQLFSIATTIVGAAGLSIETSAIATPSVGFTVGKSSLLLVGAGSWVLEFAVQ